MQDHRHRPGWSAWLACGVCSSFMGLGGAVWSTNASARDSDARGVMTAMASSASRPAVQWPRVRNAVPPNARIEKRIARLLAGMTLEQKIGQMLQPEIRYTTPADAQTYRFGSILNGGGSWPGNDQHASVADWVALADAYYDASMGPGGPAIPILWGTDAVHGHNNVIGATLFPHNIGLGATRDPALIERIEQITAREVAVTGLDWAFAPAVIVARDERWGRVYESYSEDPEIVRQYAGPAVRGLQGVAGTRSFLDAAHVLATAKHFIGDGGTDHGVDRGNNLATEQQLLDIHGQGYITALQAGVQTVMASYSSWQGNKLHGHRYLLTEVLKGRMGFDGLVVSDWNGIEEVPGCTPSKCAAAVNAGIDLFMVPQDWHAFLDNTVAQVRSGEIAQSRIDDAVTRILRVKLRAGMFEKGRPSSRPLAGKVELLGAPEHREVARRAVRESLVLLKNKGGLLPLSRRLDVLVAGDAANDIGKQSGGWSITWQGRETTNADFPGATAIFAGIKAAVASAGGTATLSVDGSYVDKPDVAIVVFGENPYTEMQGDIATIDYHGPDGGPAGADAALLQRLKQAGIPVVAVFISGRPLYVNPELNASDAFVAAWLPGSEGAGIADVLFRKSNGQVNHDFTGKLAFSWPRNVNQTTLNRRDADYHPLFPYGFGLRYSDRDTLGDDLP